MPPAIHAAVFDMDGLMLDTEPIYKVAWQAASAELGYELDDAFYGRFVGRPTHDCERDLIERYGPAFPLDRFRILWPRRWKVEVAAHGIHQKPSLTGLIGQLEARGLALAVATSTDADLAAFCLRAAGLDGRFDAIVTGDEIASGKRGSVDSGSFTINLGVSTPALHEGFTGRSFPTNRGTVLWPLNARLGHLMPGGGDRWWKVTSTTDAASIGDEIAQALRDTLCRSSISCGRRTISRIGCRCRRPGPVVWFFLRRAHSSWQSWQPKEVMRRSVASPQNENGRR